MFITLIKENLIQDFLSTKEAKIIPFASGSFIGGLLVSEGTDHPETSGIYILVDDTKTGVERIWKHVEKEYYISCEINNYFWVITSISSRIDINYTWNEILYFWYRWDTYMASENPWDSEVYFTSYPNWNSDFFTVVLITNETVLP